MYALCTFNVLAMSCTFRFIWIIILAHFSTGGRPYICANNFRVQYHFVSLNFTFFKLNLTHKFIMN